MALIPPGKLIIITEHGSNKIAVKKFFLDRFEVTQKDYKKIIGKNFSFFKDKQRPVEKVNWFEAIDYCLRIEKRLPSEWEWEWAARSGSKTKFYWGKGDPKLYSWFKNNSEKKTHPVGLKSPNSYGLFDMAGNVWEWTDSYRETTGGKVLRGGSWRNSINAMQSSKWITSLPIHRFHYVGFRCASSTPPIPKH
jgi:formylglycine-generating enzyme required for sulfatase activity